MLHEDLQRDLFLVTQRFKQISRLFRFGDLSPLEFFLLEELSDFHARQPQKQGMYASELAARTHTSPQALSRMLRALEEDGYVARAVDTDRRRNTFIRLTEQGHRTRQTVHEAMRCAAERMIEAMGEEDMRQLVRLWNRLMDIAQADASGPQKESGPAVERPT